MDEDERGADGMTVRESIAARTLEAMTKLIDAALDGRMGFDAALIALEAIVSANLPFVDPASKDVVTQTLRAFRAEAEERAEAERELRMTNGDLGRAFGEWR